MAEKSQAKPQMSVGSYHTIMREIDDTLENLRLNRKFLEPRHESALKQLLSDDSDFELMNVSEVQKMFQIVKMMRNQLLNPDSTLVVGARLQDISSLVTSINSLISLFIKHQATFDSIADNAKLKECVVLAVRDLPQAAQQKFYDRLAELDAM